MYRSWILILHQIEEKGYRRLTPCQSVGLRHCGYVIQLQEVVKNAQGGIDHLKVTCHKSTDANKPKAFIHWVAKPLKCEVRLYERLWVKDNYGLKYFKTVLRLWCLNIIV